MDNIKSGKANNHDIGIRGLYPHLNDEQLKRAEENLERYIELELRVYQRILADPEAYARFRALTSAKGNSRMESERSNSPLQVNTPSKT